MEPKYALIRVRVGRPCALRLGRMPECGDTAVSFGSARNGEALAQVAQRSCGCPTPGSVQGQLGRGLEQPGLVEGVPACGRGWNWVSFKDRSLRFWGSGVPGFHGSRVLRFWGCGLSNCCFFQVISATCPVARTPGPRGPSEGQIDSRAEW